MSATIIKTTEYDAHASAQQIPNNSLVEDRWSNEDEATATCFCGMVQMVIPLKAPGMVQPFLCNCSDCRKVSHSMFATNVTTLDTHTRFTRGEDNLTYWGQDHTTHTGKTMTNAFCKTCGTLMYRQGSAFPGTKFVRVGIVDDLRLHEEVLKPQIELFTKTRVGWWHGLGVDGVKEDEGFPFEDQTK